VLQSDTDVLAVLPLGVYADAAFRRLAWLGQDLGDYLGPLLAPEFAQSVSSERFLALWQEILRLLRSHPRLTFDVVTLCKMPGRIGGQVNPFMAQPAARHPSDGFLLTLQPPWEDFYIARRSAKARRQDKSKRARLGETGDVRMVNAQGEKEIAATIDDLLSQKSAVFARKGILDPFQRPGYREFFLHLALDARTRDLLHVSRLDVDGQPAAINLGIEYRGRYSLCLVSYDEKFARFSPGAIHLNELLHRAIERGLLEFDFLVGFQRLKQEWADRRIELYDHVAGVTPRGVLIAAALRGLARAKRTVKTSPGLWNAFLRLREATGPLRGLVQRRRR
jgi:CelD/BcsL family acetyltransferase involved in cellulose biosynthesis